MSDIKTYNSVPVSGIAFDFSQNHSTDIPHQLYAEWAALVIEVARAIRPHFEAPPFPSALVFETFSLPSDGPYPASEDYYMYDLSCCRLAGDSGEGIQISVENGRQERSDTVNIDTTGFHSGISSFIYLSSAAPLATFFVFVGAEQESAVDAVFAQNRATRAAF